MRIILCSLLPFEGIFFRQLECSAVRVGTLQPNDQVSLHLPCRINSVQRRQCRWHFFPLSEKTLSATSIGLHPHFEIFSIHFSTTFCAPLLDFFPFRLFAFRFQKVISYGNFVFETIYRSRSQSARFKSEKTRANKHYRDFLEINNNTCNMRDLLKTVTLKL